MVGIRVAVVMFLLGAVMALPTEDPILFKLGSGLRYQYMQDSEGKPHLIDQWLKASDVSSVARYNPAMDNVYHLFTRANPTVSNPMLLGVPEHLAASNYNPARRTVVLVHGFVGSPTAAINTILVPAFLDAEDVNVIVIDWSRGAGVSTITPALVNAVSSGVTVASYIDWLCSLTGTSINNFHVLGHSLGAHQAGVIGRNVRTGRIPYITALDPGTGMLFNHIFGPDAAIYTEAIHTNADGLGHGLPLAHADFYPNGGDIMPGCGVNFICNHDRCLFFMAESILSGGFTGRRCANYLQARYGFCYLPESLQMGGLRPKTGSSGIYWMQTNFRDPFSLG